MNRKTSKDRYVCLNDSLSLIFQVRVDLDFDTNLEMSLQHTPPSRLATETRLQHRRPLLFSMLANKPTPSVAMSATIDNKYGL